MDVYLGGRVATATVSSKRRIVALFDRRLVRRLIIAPLIALAAIAGVAVSPVALALAAAADMLRGGRPWPRTRVTTLVIGALVIETISMIVALITWFVSGFGFLGSIRWRWRLNRIFMGRYTSAMLSLIRRVIGTTIVWNDRADLSVGPVVLIARHTSFFDALIPATVLSRRNKLLAHHVVAQGLRYAPCIDIVGHRFPNRFITRTPGEGSSELVHIEAVGRALDHTSAAIIFPEGTFRTPERFDRALRRLRRRHPEAAARAAGLEHVLPPRSNGTFALLQGAPTADLVVCTNTGLESFGSIKAIVRQPTSDRPITVETWRIDRADIPEDADAFDVWLLEQYVVIDNWVRDTQPL